MSQKSRKYICKQIDTIISALREINSFCEKSPSVSDDLAMGYPVHLSLDEMVLEFMKWRDCVSEAGVKD